MKAQAIVLFLGCLVATPALAADGAALAKTIEKSKKKARRALLEDVQKLTLEEKKAFVQYAIKRRGKWKRLCPALAVIGSQGAVDELLRLALNEPLDAGQFDLGQVSLQALVTYAPGHRVLPALLKGLWHDDRKVAARFNSFVRLCLAGESKKITSDAALAAILSPTRELERKHARATEELADLEADAKEDPENVDTKQLKQKRAALKRLENNARLMQDLVGQALAATKQPDPFLRRLTPSDVSSFLAAGLAQGIRKRVVRTVLTARRKKAAQAKKERERMGGGFQDDEETKKPKKRRWTRRVVRPKRVVLKDDDYQAAQEDRSRFLSALENLAERDEPRVQLQTFLAVPVLLEQLDATWADYLIKGLERKLDRRAVFNAASRALRLITGAIVSNNHIAWRAWWAKKGANQ